MKESGMPCLRGVENAVPLSTLFERARLSEDAAGGQWQVLDDALSTAAGPVQVCVRPYCPESSVLRVCGLMRDVNPETAALRKSPECYVPEWATVDGTLKSCDVVHTFAPGDAVVRHTSAWSLGLEARVRATLGAAPRIAPASASGAGELSRVSLRRDFPEEGCWTLVRAPYDAETEDTVEAQGSRAAMTIVFRPDQEGTRYTFVQRNFAGPAMSYIMGTALRLGGFSAMNPLKGLVSSFISFRAGKGPYDAEAPTGDREIAERIMDEEGFRILRVLKCSRGPPLRLHIDRCTHDRCTDECTHEWHRHEWHRQPEDAVQFRFAAYLRTLAPGVEFHDVVHGRVLVPYQCAVKRKEWAKVRDAVKTLIAEQKSAYRRVHGGTDAPSLSDKDTERPRFQHEPFHAPIERDGGAHACALPVSKTFIHFPERCTSSCCNKESASVPEMPSLVSHLLF